MNNFTIVIADDEKNQRESLAGYLAKKGFRTFTAENAASAIKIISRETVDIVLSDYRMPDKTGLELLKACKAINPDIGFVIITAYETVENAVEAMRNGAEDYLPKPVDFNQLDILIERIIEKRDLKSELLSLREQLSERRSISSIISASPNMNEVIAMASRAAESKATILITGESGTGKEVLAKAVHQLSPRRNMPFVPVNISALPGTLVESELFGHERGAFTGAEKLRKGRFESAHGGTIFLDEIGDFELPLQVKLLRVLQEHQVQRIGSNETIDIDVRVVAATHQNLEKKILEGAFREDLYYRLNIITLHIPPLRERREDILPLIDHFLRKFGEENGRAGIECSKETIDQLMKYNYPGNVRELENIIERSVVLARGGLITTKELPVHVKGFHSESNTDLLRASFDSFAAGSLNEQVEALERNRISAALDSAHGNQTQAAKLLGLTERNLRYKLSKYGLKEPEIE